MGTVHFVGGEKGGVGKSLTARLLAQYFIDRRQPLLGFDSDQSHGSFSRFYGEFAAPLIVDDYESLDGLLEAAEANPGHQIIIDLAAQTSSRMGQWIDESAAFELLDELGCRIYIWHVMDDGADSRHLLDKALDDYSGQNLQLVVVQNHGRGENFDSLEQSATWQRVNASSAKVLRLGKLHSKTVQKIDLNDFSFWSAANNRDALTMGERQRVRVWLRRSYAQLDELL